MHLTVVYFGQEGLEEVKTSLEKMSRSVFFLTDRELLIYPVLVLWFNVSYELHMNCIRCFFQGGELLQLHSDPSGRGVFKRSGSGYRSPRLEERRRLNVFL